MKTADAMVLIKQSYLESKELAKNTASESLRSYYEGIVSGLESALYFLNEPEIVKMRKTKIEEFEARS